MSCTMCMRFHPPLRPPPISRAWTFRGIVVYRSSGKKVVARERLEAGAHNLFRRANAFNMEGN
jgi:hypothetical protein